MSSLRDQLGGLVYSTESGRLCSECGNALNECSCAADAEAAYLASLDGIVRIRRETGGRKGKEVTTVSGVPLNGKELKALTKKLKQRCGTGGALKDGLIEIQGDHRNTLKTVLEAEGFKVRLSGG